MTPAQRRAVALLAVGQTLTYAGVYYAFPAVLPALETLTGWSKETLAWGPTLSYILMAALTPVTGRLVDRGMGGELLTVLPAIAALCVALMGFVTEPLHWLALWAVVGVTQAGCLYETCFAFLTRRLGAEARPAIVLVTLIAGFSGTLAFPFGHFMVEWAGVKGALIGYAALMVAIGVPANLGGVRILRATTGAAGEERRPAAPGMVRAAMVRPAFWGLTALISMAYLDHGIFLTYILELFTSQGATPAIATMAAATVGPSQVVGRFLLMLYEARIDNRAATYGAIAGMAGAALSLWLAGFAPSAVFLAAVCHGAGIGIMSILRPVLIATYLGREGFGAISGAVAVGPILASAGAPVIGAWLLGHGGTDLVIWALLGTMTAAAIVWTFMRRARPIW